MREGGGGRWEGEREEVGGWISGLVHQEFTRQPAEVCVTYARQQTGRLVVKSLTY